MADEPKLCDGAGAEPHLPMVESSRLDGMEDEAASHVARNCGRANDTI